MDLLPTTNAASRRPAIAWYLGRVAWCGIYVWLLLGTASHAQQLQIQIGNGPEAAGESTYGVYLPTDRTLARGVAQARERITDREYNEAINFLQAILDRDEDEFLDDAASASANQGLKATARQLIAGLPSQGREAYQLLHSADARRGLEAAIAADDSNQLAQVVRRYSLTPAGREASLALAQTELDRGHPLAAAHLYQQLIDDRQADDMEPQLSLLAARSWAVARQPDRVVSTLRTLIRRSPEATVLLAGRSIHLPSPATSDAELVSWLTESIGMPQIATLPEQDWLTERGDPARNYANRGGAPHLSPRWQARVVNDPRLESFLSGRREQFQQRGVTAIPAARPIAVGDVVLMRTPHNVVAVDFRTGKRIWETRAEGDDTRDQSPSGAASNEDGDEPSTATYPLEQRVWDDTLANALSSDGDRVFVLSDTSPTLPPENNAWGMMPGPGGLYDATASPTNRLTAYELATEGKLAWQVDGENAASDLAGAFYLGPPLAINGSLYVLAEIRSAVYLLALDPQTGHLQWRQQLAGLEMGIAVDPARRLTGVTPSQGDGILVCPTTAGVVVAVDMVHREFAWSYRYQRRAENPAIFQQNLQGRPEGMLVRDNNRWLDGSVIIADGHVFLTPPESSELHCLDLQTGALLWKHPRENSLFVACVDQGNVLLVSNSSVTAKRVSDWSPAWTAAPADNRPKQADHIDFPANVQPAGLGYLSEGQYYLPLTSGHVVAIDVAKGTMTDTPSPHGDTELGNLICHRGAVLSQSALFLNRFEQLDVLRQRAEAALAQNPRDSAAIRDLAEIRRLDGGRAEAIKMLKQAYAIDASDPVTGDMLADCLLEALAANYAANQADLPLLREIVQTPQQQIDLLRIDAMGLQSLGQHQPAFAAYLKLADALGRDSIALKIDDNRTVRSDSWIRGRLTALWADSTPDDQAAMAREVERSRQTWGRSPTANQLRRHLSLFGGLPGSDDVRVQLARQLLEHRDSLDAQVLILKLEHSADPKIQAAAGVLLTQWLVASDRLEEARQAATSLAEQWRDVPVLDGKTGGQWIAELLLAPKSDGRSASRDWPLGQVTVNLSSTPSPTPAQRAITLRSRDQVQVGLRNLTVEQDYHPGLGTSQWFIAPDGSRLIGRDTTGEEAFRWSAAQGPQQRRAGINVDLVSWSQAAKLGDLLYVSLGNQVLALDCRSQSSDSDAGVVWQSNPTGRIVLAPLNGARRHGSQNLYVPASGRARPNGQASGMIARLGPATPSGVVLQEQQQLRCVDPMSGETLWIRTDIPANCELFGDDDYVFAASVDEGLIYVVNMKDGELIDRRDLPATPWLLTAGRNIAQIIDSPNAPGKRKQIRVTDIVSGEQKFIAEYDSGLRTATIEPNAIAIVEPPDRIKLAQSAVLAAFRMPVAVESSPGRIQVLDVATGKLIIDRPAQNVVQPTRLYAFKAGEQLFLGVSGDSRRSPSATIGIDVPVIDGQIFAFDLQTGEPSWPGPATISHRGMALAAPTDMPLLIFADRVQKRDASNTGAQLRLLCLDKRTGATVYRNDDLPDTAGQQFRIHAAHEPLPSVTVEMSARSIRLDLTDRPRPPEPPANDLVESPRKTLGRGLWGVGRRMTDLIQEKIQNPNGADLRDGSVQPADSGADATPDPADDNN